MEKSKVCRICMLNICEMTSFVISQMFKINKTSSRASLTHPTHLDSLSRFSVRMFFCAISILDTRLNRSDRSTVLRA